MSQKVIEGIVLATCLLFAAIASGQEMMAEPAEVHCPSVLGVGVNTDLAFCDILIQQDAGLGARVVLPTHQGEATVSFNLHNRHTYSEDEVEAGRAFASYTAEIAVASFEGDVLGRRFIQSEFRSGDDLVDRITGGAGPRGLKAISPTGTERVFVKIPGELNEVFIVGQSLQVLRTEAHESIVDAGRTVAVISDVRVDYQP
jgi:hypothetical protein